MRLVTYDRDGDRRLGAWVHDAVVDLPDAVGHPAFPATLEALITRHRGTALEAARAALANPSYVEEARVRSPRFLAPLALAGAERGRVLGPGEDVRWPEGTACRWQPELACVLGRSGRDLSPEAAWELVFGYLMVSTWSPGGDDGGDPSVARLATTLGPCVVTAEDFDPCQVTATARVNGGVWIRERMGDAASRFAHTIALASREREVSAGEIFSSSPFDRPVPGGGARELTRGATMELEAGVFGVLRNRLRFVKAVPRPEPVGAGRTR
ncbi:MAG TPA: fumarylacetoacetate hydrolase family protein [Actinomycetota bacterium]